MHFHAGLEALASRAHSPCLPTENPGKAWALFFASGVARLLVVVGEKKLHAGFSDPAGDALISPHV
jgi:hypothetical protein